MAESYLIRMIQRRDTEVNWNSANPILEAGEFGYNTSNGKIKLGDGVTPWNALPYFVGSNGDDVVVSWDDITGKPQIGTGTIFFENNSGKQYGKVPLNSTEDITVKFPIDDGTGETGKLKLIDLYTADNATLLELYNEIYDINPPYIDKIVHYKGKICSNFHTYENGVRFWHWAVCEETNSSQMLNADRPFQVHLTKDGDTVTATYTAINDVCQIINGGTTETWTFAMADGTTIEKQVIVK